MDIVLVICYESHSGARVFIASARFETRVFIGAKWLPSWIDWLRIAMIM